MQDLNPIARTEACCGDCGNIAARHCTKSVHNARAVMLANQGATGSRNPGRMFPGAAYPVFENGLGMRYLREYAPLHLPQVEHGLGVAYAEIVRTGMNPSRILDIGSGPGTTALALRNLLERNQVAGRFQIAPLEPSSEFCGMLERLRDEWRHEPTHLHRPLKLKLDQYLASDTAVEADWIVMANVLSPLVAGKDPVYCCELIQRLLEKQSRAGRSPFLTLIEGSCSTYINPYAHIRALAQKFNVVARLGLDRSTPLYRPYILDCRYYLKAGQRGCQPRLIMLTLAMKR
jgi:hypothetical protein